MQKFDVTILTARMYLADDCSQTVLLEDSLLAEALERKGLGVTRTNWDNPAFLWSETRYAIFRTTWDYAARFDEFSAWLDKARRQTELINPPKLIYWNIDKFYLRDMIEKGINVPGTSFIEKGADQTLEEILAGYDWKEVILKPSVSCSARHTYRFTTENTSKYETIFKALIANERMLLQEFQASILTEGEISCILFGGKYSHSVIKRPKPGDFRVQDDFGGTVHPYQANDEEIDFIERTVAACDPLPMYARVDVLRDNDGQLSLGELELIEPELWFRLDDSAADKLAEVVYQHSQK